MNHNKTGSSNTGDGLQALANNMTGDNNKAIGLFALIGNIGGNGNTAAGFQALGQSTGSSNIGVGNNAGFNLTSGNNNIDIGNSGKTSESGKIRIGTQGIQNGTFIAGIASVTVTGSPVVVNSTGKLGISSTSSARFKDAIKPMDKSSEAILALKPVTFRYKEEIDPDGTPQFGLVAEDVEKVNPQLVTRDQDGKPYTVRYEAVNAMLLNEFLKEHRKVEQLEKQVQILAAGLEKMSSQSSLDKTGP